MTRERRNDDNPTVWRLSSHIVDVVESLSSICFKALSFF